MLVKQPLRVILVIVLTVCLIISPTLLSMGANKLENIATAQTSKSVPQGYIGVWRGSGIVQDNGSEEWSILIALTPGGFNTIVGTSAYPTLKCGGELNLREVTNESIELLEHITYGNNCINNGIMTLKQASARRLEYLWRSPINPLSKPLNATGNVQKISGN